MFEKKPKYFSKSKVENRLISQFDQIERKFPPHINNNDIHVPRVKKFVFELMDKIYTDELVEKLGNNVNKFTVTGSYGGGSVFGTCCIMWELEEDQLPSAWIDVISDKFQMPECLYFINFEKEPFISEESKYWSREVEEEKKILERVRKYISYTLL